MKHEAITNAIIGAFYAVYGRLGYGFSERVYENALVLELRKRGLAVEQQKPLRVFYDGECVGEFFVDLLVDGVVIVELKAVVTLQSVHDAQVLNYLKASQFELGLLLNFGPRPEVRRKVYDNARKGSLEWLDSSAKT